MSCEGGAGEWAEDANFGTGPVKALAVGEVGAMTGPMSAKERINELKKQFSDISAWEDRYKKIIAMGKELPELDEKHKVEKNIVKGCQSQVWLVAHLKEGLITFQADSDAVIVRGLVSILLQVYSGCTPDEVLATPPTFLEDLGFKSNLSPSRSNGLFSMVKQIQFYAMAFKALQAQQS